jgi:hypothetical protein
MRIQAQLQDDRQSDALDARDLALGVLIGDPIEGGDGALGGEDTPQELAVREDRRDAVLTQRPTLRNYEQRNARTIPSTPTPRVVIRGEEA